MPIRFACPHCRQKLTVSSKKAGTSADCPRCKQSLTIPDPPPGAMVEPRAGEAEAGSDAREAETKPAAGESQESKGHEAVAAPVAASPVSEAASAARAAASPQPSRSLPTFELPMELVDEGFGSFELVYDHDEEPLAPIERPSADLVAVPRYVIYTQGGLLALVAAVAFALGLAAGGAILSGPLEPPMPQACVIAGSVTYASGARQLPDGGAVVAVIPRSAERPDEKAPVAGLRPSDPTPADGHRGVTILRGLGGDYTRTDADGRFELKVPDRGQYLVLIVSHEKQLRSADDIRTTDLLKLGPYFDNAADLLDKHAYQLLEETIRGDRELSVAFD